LREYQRPIKYWPEDERPRERLLSKGAEVLSDAELLAILLRTGDASSGLSALDIALHLLAKFGGLRGIDRASPAELEEVPGMGPAKAAAVKAALALGRRFASEVEGERVVFRSSSDVARYYLPKVKGLKKEVAKVWGIKYYEIYGLSEIIGPGVSNSCDFSDELHIFEDHFYPEIIDPKTKEVLPYGEKGELVITTLTKQALPIIRYRTGGITTLNPTPCRCGRTHIRMHSVMGRADDMLIVNGVNVFPSQVEHILSNVDLSTVYFSFK